MRRAEDEKVNFSANVLTMFIVSMERCYPHDTELPFNEYMKAVYNDYEATINELTKKAK